MRFVTTRQQAPPVSFTDALYAGLAPDGGLYVPETIEAWTAEDLSRLPPRTLTENGLRARRHPVSGRPRQSDAGSAADDVQRGAWECEGIRRRRQLRRLPPADARCVRRRRSAPAHAADVGQLGQRRPAAAAIGLLLSRRRADPGVGGRAGLQPCQDRVLDTERE